MPEEIKNDTTAVEQPITDGGKNDSSKQKQPVVSQANGIAYGAALGLAAGIALGLITGYVAVCVAGGALAGLAAGYIIDVRTLNKRHQKEQDAQKREEE